MCADTLLAYAAQVQDVKRQSVVRIFADTTPILQRLNFIDIGDAMGYEYDREASLPGVGLRSLNGNYPEQVEGQIVPVREGTAILGGLVKTDWQMAQNASRKSSRIAAKVGHDHSQPLDHHVEDAMQFASMRFLSKHGKEP